MLKQVYDLAKALEKDQEHVRLTQALTLDASRPSMGLRGRFGLFGSSEWWASIRSGRLKTKTYSGVIERTYFAGQDSRWGDQVNSFRLRLDDGSLVDESIYALAKADKKLFVPGARVTMVYVLDEMKAQPAADGGINDLEIVLEMAVSAP